MRKEFNINQHRDPDIHYRGINSSRLDNLTDAVFGIAITLLIFNLSNPNSFDNLLTFTKTLPAFLISISIIILIWNEHLRFSEIYTLNNFNLGVINLIFIALIIFYVYPLRFLTMFLTNFFFQTDIDVSIQFDQVPHLMIYYGFFAFAIYFVIYLFYYQAYKIRETLSLSEYEIFYTINQKKRLLIMFIVPLISIALTFILYKSSFIWAPLVGGLVYNLYAPLIIIWKRKYSKQLKQFKESVPE